MMNFKFDIGFQYLGEEYGLIPYIGCKYIEQDGKELDALENIYINKLGKNEFEITNTEREVLELIEKSSFNVIEVSCAGVHSISGNQTSYVSPKGSINNSLVEIPSRISVNPKFLFNLDISFEDKCAVIAKMYTNMYFNSKKKQQIGFGASEKESTSFDFYYGDINLDDLSQYASNLEGMLCNMLINHNKRRSKAFINEVTPKKL